MHTVNLTNVYICKIRNKQLIYVVSLLGKHSRLHCSYISNVIVAKVVCSSIQKRSYSDCLLEDRTRENIGGLKHWRMGLSESIGE